MSETSYSQPASASDREEVARLLGRELEGEFSVVVRGSLGTPLVIENAPFLRDGTPMPTRFWLVDPQLRRAVSRLEAEGGVREAQAQVRSEDIAQAHACYERQRDRLITSDHRGPRPAGGVGGTRQGVKCLHAHLAWYLAGGEDPVGRWVADRLGIDVELRQTASI